MDRRIRHHLSRARLAALGGPERARTLLAPRVADHIGAFEKLYADKGLAYETRIAPDIALACEAQDLDELLGNLIDNASKWARRRCQGNGGSSTCSATAISRAAIYAARARHSAKATERLCL
jgi:signal transduction histidine kinase